MVTRVIFSYWINLFIFMKCSYLPIFIAFTLMSILPDKSTAITAFCLFFPICIKYLLHLFTFSLFLFLVWSKSLVGSVCSGLVFFFKSIQAPYVFWLERLDHLNQLIVDTHFIVYFVVLYSFLILWLSSLVCWWISVVLVGFSFLHFS